MFFNDSKKFKNFKSVYKVELQINIFGLKFLRNVSDKEFQKFLDFFEAGELPTLNELHLSITTSKTDYPLVKNFIKFFDLLLNNKIYKNLENVGFHLKT